MSSETTKYLSKIKQTYITALNNIKEWSKFAPFLGKALEEIELIETAEKEAPNEAKESIDESLLSQLQATSNSITVLSSLSELPKNIDKVVTTSGTSISVLYINHLKILSENLSDNVHVIEWANKSKARFLDYRGKQDRSNQVNIRLSQMNPKLTELHTNSIDSTHMAATEIQKSIEAAATLRELLDQFKGFLLNKCKTGKGKKFSRIANNIVVDSDATQTAVIDSQVTYDNLHSELSRIIKSRKEVSGDDMLDLLRQVEDLIWIVTSSLDPEFSGFNFS